MQDIFFSCGIQKVHSIVANFFLSSSFHINFSLSKQFFSTILSCIEISHLFQVFKKILVHPLIPLIVSLSYSFEPKYLDETSTSILQLYVQKSSPHFKFPFSFLVSLLLTFTFIFLHLNALLTLSMVSSK